MNDRHVVVFLGGTSGIGREAVKTLLASPQPRMPWHIILGSRTPERNAYGDGSANHRYDREGDIVNCLPLDLSRLESVHRFVSELDNYLGGPIHTLVLCSGMICSLKRRITQDGYDETLQVNALAVALLLDLLWPRLLATGKTTRILFVSSGLHMRAAKDKRLTPSTLDTYLSLKGYRPMSAYADSKLLLMHIFFLTHNRSQSGSSSPEHACHVLSLSPGFVPRTGLIREAGCIANFSSKWILPLLPFAKSPQQSGAFIAKFVTETPLSVRSGSDGGTMPLLPRSGTYISISKGKIPAADECYDQQVRDEWYRVLRDKGLWH